MMYGSSRTFCSSLVKWFSSDFQSWLCHLYESLTINHTCDSKNVINYYKPYTSIQKARMIGIPNIFPEFPNQLMQNEYSYWCVMDYGKR